MKLLKAMIERVEIEKKWLPLIHEELKKYNEKTSQQTHELKAVFSDVKMELVGLAKSEAEFTETLRRFFAISTDLRLREEKRRLEELGELKPGKHDELF